MNQAETVSSKSNIENTMIHLFCQNCWPESPKLSICGTKLKGELKPGYAVDCVVCRDMWSAPCPVCAKGNCG